MGPLITPSFKLLFLGNPVPGCVRIACSGLMMTAANLMQVDCQDFLFTSLMQVVSTTCSKSANIKLQ